eukprot:CAMPEP_0113701134 /NCGR_PEP_ID=MMETSP0038_2-20120614/24388_1 /TAXON_ID=2898 /ORGANISM="Cryptomonas paramecium" /LENGTH=147 /DNA_ID=CAMNT_0000624957 /DNA_START=380 /DNA_END=820 /DNA_ORIENTATION=+ /assembly_acc=CAM_ASM_000170
MVTGQGKDKDDRVERLVEKADAIIDRLIQKELFRDAAALQDDLSRLHLDDSLAVLQANTRYYQAFSNKDLERMSALWLRGVSVQCVHPGLAPLTGYNDIMAMFRVMFQSQDKVFRSTTVRPANVSVTVRASSAHVLCTEEVLGPVGA